MKNSIFLLTIFGFFVLLFAVGCGGSNGGEGAGAPTEFEIGTEGGVIELKNVASITIPDGSFASGSTMSVKEKAEQETLDNYNISADLFMAGDSFGRYLKVNSTSLPEKDILIEYTVSTDFINSLGNDFVPRLFVQVFQLGADDEFLDYFEPLDFELSGGVLSATIPKEAFTDFRSENAGEFEAIILIGSSPTDRVQVVNKFGLSMKLQATTTDTCQGTTLGSPLEGVLEITSPFGDRGVHKGVDLRAATGDNVLATADGTIFKIGFDERNTPNRFGGKKKGWGRYVIITHTDGSQSLYAHLVKSSTDSLIVGNAVVKSTTIIGKANSTGGVTGPHLHLEYVPNGQIFANKDQKIDPFPCINANLTGQITLSDNGTLADDSFSLTLDGILIGTTNIGASNNFAINNLRVGEHTIRIDAVVVPDDIGTLQIDLGDNVTFTDGTKSRSEILSTGGSITFQIIVGAPV